MVSRDSMEYSERDWNPGDIFSICDRFHFLKMFDLLEEFLLKVSITLYVLSQTPTQGHTFLALNFHSRGVTVPT